MEYSTVVAKNLEGFCQEIRKQLAEEANKEEVSAWICFISYSLPL